MIGLLPDNLTTFTRKWSSGQVSGVYFLCALQGGNCAVIGVKAELGVPDPSSPNAGKLEFFVDW